MEIAHLVPTSLIDYPGRVASVVFTVGCNFRCPFCHNRELVLPERSRGLHLRKAEEILALLSERRTFLDGLVITGGEPTVQPDLLGFAGEVKRFGLLVKLDTNGSRPKVLEELLRAGLVDYVAMDVKSPLSRYPEFVGGAADSGAIGRSIDVVRKRAPDYEFRTTAAPGLGLDDLRAIADLLSGARRWFLQPFVVPDKKGLVDPTWAGRPALSAGALREAWGELGTSFSDGGVR